MTLPGEGLSYHLLPEKLELEMSRDQAWDLLHAKPGWGGGNEAIKLHYAESDHQSF